MAVRLFLMIFLLSTSFSYTINYSIDVAKFNYENNHFKMENANSTILVNEKVYDIHRIELIVSSVNDIKYTIKNIKWNKTDQEISDFHNQETITIGDIFNFRSCPHVYVDIFPYK